MSTQHSTEIHFDWCSFVNALIDVDLSIVYMTFEDIIGNIIVELIEKRVFREIIHLERKTLYRK